MERKVEEKSKVELSSSLSQFSESESRNIQIELTHLPCQNVRVVSCLKPVFSKWLRYNKIMVSPNFSERCEIYGAEIRDSSHQKGRILELLSSFMLTDCQVGQFRRSRSSLTE